MIYGTRAVIEAIAAGKEIDKVMIQSGLSNDLVKELIAVARNNNIPITFVPAEKLKRISSKNHQGVICLLSIVCPLLNIDTAYAIGHPLILR